MVPSLLSLHETHPHPQPVMMGVFSSTMDQKCLLLSSTRELYWSAPVDATALSVMTSGTNWRPRSSADNWE